MNSQQPSATKQSQPPVENTLWSKTVPIQNYVFLVINMAFVFGLNIFIIISNPDLTEYWYMMLWVFGGFVITLLLENFFLANLLKNKVRSGLDMAITVLILLKNLLVLANLIPLVQLLGLLVLFLGGWLLALVYIILIIIRLVKS